MQNVVLFLHSYYVEAPVGLANFPHEIIGDAEAFVKHRYLDLVQYTYMPRGGHFPALEEPELLAQDVQSFVRKVEERNRKS